MADIDSRHLPYLTAVVITVALTALAIPVGAGSPGDPTAELLPGVDCDSPTCQQAATAFSQREYAEAGALFVAHFDDATASDDADDELAGAWLVHAAYAHQRAGAWDDAAELYLRAADKIEPLRAYLLTQAVRASLESDGRDAIFDRALEARALEAGYRDGYFLRARLETRSADLPSSDTLLMALAENPDDVCPWIFDVLDGTDLSHASPTALLNFTHAHCIDDQLSDILDGFSYEPTATARLARANRLAAQVRFEDTLAELDRIDRDELDAVDVCKADFRRARSHFFLRQRQAAENIYRTIVDDCTDDANEDQRVRSLYAVGNRNYQRGRLDEAERFFQILYDEYPHRSHADDALFFLARVERRRSEPDREREVALLIEALEKYPQEDMIHEFAWEVYEPVFRRGDYREFIDAVTALPLPQWDREYFSQGRLEYFVGLASARLDELDDAERYWQLAWVKYPFSFYGYLSHLRLLEYDRTPEALEQPPGANPHHWFDDDFRGTGADILARAGHLEGACDFESARLASIEADRADRWRLATLCHQAGNHPVSHDIARRQISGRPWSLPVQGRLARWHVAWPDPYADDLQQAIDEHGPDSTELAIYPALASAIMREESAFHEDIVSWAGAVGLMQLMPGTARMHDDVIEGRSTIERLKKPHYNIPIGIDHIAMLSRSFDGHPVLMTAAYNAGSGRIRGWLRRQPNDEIALWVEDIPILQTRDYTKRVIGSYAAYQYLQGHRELDDRILNPAR